MIKKKPDYLGPLNKKKKRKKELTILLVHLVTQFEGL